MSQTKPFIRTAYTGLVAGLLLLGLLSLALTLFAEFWFNDFSLGTFGLIASSLLGFFVIWNVSRRKLLPQALVFPVVISFLDFLWFYRVFGG